MASTLIFANNAGSTLSGSISNTALSLNLQAGGGALFPNPSGSQYFVMTAIDAATGLLREIMHCTARSSDTLTIVRAQEGTTALNWNAGDLIQELWTAGQAGAMVQTANAGTVFVPVVPGTVWYVDGALGSDIPTNGLTSGTGAFQTPAYAVSQIGKYFSASQVTVNIAAWGTNYTGFGVGQSLISSWSLIGAGTGSTTLAASSFATNSGYALLISGSVVNVSGVKLSAVGGCLLAILSQASFTSLALVGGGSLCFGIYADYGSVVTNNTASTVTYSGTYQTVLQATQGGGLTIGYSSGAGTRTITMTNSSANVSAGATVTASAGGTVQFYPTTVTFSGGNPTGPKYISVNTGLINTQGSGTSYLPGSTAGTAQNTFNYA
jgi:hypothetical protein